MKEPSNLTQGERAISGLIELIKKNNYKPGDKLPTEMELVDLLGVSKNMVREALRALVSRNIVVIRQGAGTFLSEKQGVVDDPFGFQLIKDKRKLTEDSLQIRSILEPQIAALAAQNGTEEEFEELGRRLRQLEQAMEKKGDFFLLDARFHEQIAICTHNVLMKNLIPVISEGISVFAQEVSVTEYEITLRSHRKIYEAIIKRHPMEAQQEMMYHILYNNERYGREKVIIS